MLKMEHRNAFWFLLFLFLTTLPFQGKALSNENVSPVVEKHQRKTLIETEYGSVSAVEIQDGFRPPYHLQFFTLDPNSLFLPVLLHADMVFYVHTGNGKLFWAEEDDGISSINIRPGDITRLKTGSVFYLQSNLDTARQKLRIFAMFPSTDHNNYDPSIGAYSRINELFRGFDKRIMQAALQAPEELVEAITNKTETPAIVHAVSKEQTKFWELEVWFLNSILGREIGNAISSNGKKLKSYNIFDNDPDFQNCYGWSLTVTHKQLKSLKPTNIGLLMVNLTAGSMMGPHWNPGATEIIMVLQGEGMVRVVCGSSYTDKSKCQNMRFKVKEGDIFLVPRFHPMAQMSFNNDSLVFMGFSTTVKKTYPQFLAGKKSVFQTIDKHIMATSLNVTKTTIEQLLDSQGDSIMLGCLSCAEEEERIMIEEAKRREEEEARRREEEKRREEEEARRREEEKRREEEEARRREEEKRREEEEARRREEEKKREEEEARRREEEKRRREEEEARRREEEERREEEAKREQEEARKEQERREKQKEKEEEEAEAEAAAERKKRQQEEEAKREQEEARKEQERREKQKEKEAEAAAEEWKKRQQEEEAKREQEEARKEQERREKQKEKEEEAAAEEWKKRQQEEEAKREQEEARKEQERREKQKEKEEEEAAAEEWKKRQQEEEAKREQEEARKEQERRETQKKKEEEERKKREQERAKRQQEEREKEKEQERKRGGGDWEQEEARRQEEEMERRREEEEKAEQARRQQKEWERRQGEGQGGVEQARRREEDEREIEALRHINGRSFKGMRILKIKKLE